MITDEHRAKAREVMDAREWHFPASLRPDWQTLENRIAQALAEQQEKDARIAEGTDFRAEDIRVTIAAAIRAGGGNERAP